MRVYMNREQPSVTYIGYSTIESINGNAHALKLNSQIDSHFIRHDGG